MQGLELIKLSSKFVDRKYLPLARLPNNSFWKLLIFYHFLKIKFFALIWETKGRQKWFYKTPPPHQHHHAPMHHPMHQPMQAQLAHQLKSHWMNEWMNESVLIFRIGSLLHFLWIKMYSLALFACSYKTCPWSDFNPSGRIHIGTTLYCCWTK